MTPQGDFRRIGAGTAVRRRSLVTPFRAPPHRLLPETHPLHYRREEHLVDSGRQKESARIVMHSGGMGYQETVAGGMIEMWESVMKAGLQADGD